MSKGKTKKPKSGPGAAGGANRQPKPGPTKPVPAETAPAIYETALGWICLLALAALAFLMSFHTLIDTDIFWHLKTGEIIFNTRKVPTTDIYSFTVAGREWVDSQWLFQLAMYALYHFSGYAGMIVFGSLLGSAMVLLALWPGFSRGRYFAGALFGLVSLLALSLRLKLRPEIFTFFFIALEIFLLGRFRRGSKPALYGLPFLLLLWANSEGLWPVYFVILGAFLLDEIFAAWSLPLGRFVARISPVPAKTAALRLLVCAACSIPLAFLNPQGGRGVFFPWMLFREVSSETNLINELINDLQSPFERLAALDQGVFIALMVLSALFFANMFYRRTFAPGALLLWAGFLYLAVNALRNVALFALVTLALLSLLLSENADRLFPPPVFGLRLRRWRLAGTAAVLAAIVFFGQDLARSRYFMRNGMHAHFGVGALPVEYPIRGGNFLHSIMSGPAGLVPLKIFADTESSAYFIWKGWPEWRLYFDPRMEVYGEKLLGEFVDMLEIPSKFHQADLIHDFDAAVLSSFQVRTNLILSLARDPRWAPVYMDGYSVIFLKHKPALGPAIAQHRLDFSQGFATPVPPDLTGPWLARELNCRGYLMLMLGLPERALPDLEAANDISPDDSENNYYLGWTLNILQRFAEARPHLEKTLQKQPELIPNRIQLGRTYAMTGEPERALKIFEIILAANPQEITACMDIAKTYELILQSPQAHGHWQRCRQIYQGNPAMFAPVKEEIFQALDRTAKTGR